MNKREATRLLRAEARKLRALPYPQLVDRLADKKLSLETVAPSGATYHIEAEGFWDDRAEHELRVVMSIDDGGLRTLLPITDSFTIAPNGAIIESSPAG